MLAVGLMSGTSLDGVDAALVEILPRGAGYDVRLRKFLTRPFERDLRDALLAVLPPNAGGLAALAHLHRSLGRAYAAAVGAIAPPDPIGYVASHGQTVWHDGAAHVTLQVGDAFEIREAAKTTVCYDFRSADCVAGGHGAPLTAYVDALLLNSASQDRVAVNLGGIANVTLLKAGARPQDVRGFDTGPANMLLDAFVRDRTRGVQSFDRGGALAAAGRVDDALLLAMLADAYFEASPPKTTGRERFGVQFLRLHAEALARLSLEDGLATLTELSAATIAQAVAREGFGDAHVFVSGGGACNSVLLSRLAARLGRSRVETTDVLGMPVEAKEAIVFAVLGYETLRGRAANALGATGAARRVALGAIAPYGLLGLLAQIESECAGAA
ncbi:MAG: anhydro-N-acetylmuramic acid kinase [Candidatus Cybelea sp.]